MYAFQDRWFLACNIWKNGYIYRNMLLSEDQSRTPVEQSRMKMLIFWTDGVK